MSPISVSKRVWSLAEAAWPDRRIHRRYPLALELRYKLIRRHEVIRAGSGKTANISTGGVLFEADAGLPAGGKVELSVIWPLTLSDACPLQLKIRGHIVRSEANRTAVKTDRYEFRTIGVRSTERASGISRTQSIVA